MNKPSKAVSRTQTLLRLLVDKQKVKKVIEVIGHNKDLHVFHTVKWDGVVPTGFGRVIKVRPTFYFSSKQTTIFTTTYRYSDLKTRGKIALAEITKVMSSLGYTASSLTSAALFHFEHIKLDDDNFDTFMFDDGFIDWSLNVMFPMNALGDIFNTWAVNFYGDPLSYALGLLQDITIINDDGSIIYSKETGLLHKPKP